MALQESLEDTLLAQAPAASPPSAAGARRRIQLWDLPVRLFHWSLVACVTAAIVTGKLGGDWMPWHGRAGQAIVGLVVFRVVWGLVGSRHARFASFVPGPPTLLAYLKGQWRGVGHNPLGALSVLALLTLLAAQAVTGLFGNDDIAFTGPLYGLVDEAFALQLTGWHRLLVNVLFGLLALHVVAILFHVHVKKDNIVKPMVTGWKDVDAEALRSDSGQGRTGGWGALAMAVGLGLLAAFAAGGGFVREQAPAPVVTPASASSGPAAAW